MEFWCHICKRETEVSEFIQCNQCQNSFVEEIEGPDQQPELFVPYRRNPRSRIITDMIMLPSMNSRRPVLSNGSDPGLDAIIHQIMMNDSNRYGPPPASKEIVSSLTEIFITSDVIATKGMLHKGVDEYGERIDPEQVIIDCSVCREIFNSGDTALEMPCFHLFHKPCIVAWLESHNNCPTCRYELATDDPDYEARRLNK